LHERVFDVFDADAADGAGDERGVRIEFWGFVEELAKADFVNERGFPFNPKSVRSMVET